MVDRLRVPRTDWRAVMVLFVALLVVAMGASLVTPVLIPTLGLVVVGAGLFLPPRADRPGRAVPRSFSPPSCRGPPRPTTA